MRSEYKTLTRPRNNHLQNVFIDPRVLRVDAAISYLAVLVPKKEKKTECGQDLKHGGNYCSHGHAKR